MVCWLLRCVTGANISMYTHLFCCLPCPAMLKGQVNSGRGVFSCCNSLSLKEDTQTGAEIYFGNHSLARSFLLTGSFDCFLPQICTPICVLFTRKINSSHGTGNPSIYTNSLICCLDLCNVCPDNLAGFSNCVYVCTAFCRQSQAHTALTLHQLSKNPLQIEIWHVFCPLSLPLLLHPQCSLAQWQGHLSVPEEDHRDMSAAQELLLPLWCFCMVRKAGNLL